MRRVAVWLLHLLLYKSGRPSKTSLLLLVTWLVLLGMLIVGARAELLDRGLALLGVVAGLYVGNHALVRSPSPFPPGLTGLASPMPTEPPGPTEIPGGGPEG